MGMFDSFIASEDILCSQCEHNLGKEVQVKNLDQSLAIFKPGDVVESLSTKNDDIIFEDYVYCSKCSTKTYVHIAIKSNIFIDIFDSYQNANDAINDFDILSYYKIQYNKRMKVEQKLYELFLAIQGINNLNCQSVTDLKDKHFFHFMRYNDVNVDISESIRLVIENFKFE